MWLLISILSVISPIKEMNPNTRKSMPKLETQPSVRNK